MELSLSRRRAPGCIAPMTGSLTSIPSAFIAPPDPVEETAPLRDDVEAMRERGYNCTTRSKGNRGSLPPCPNGKSAVSQLAAGDWCLNRATGSSQLKSFATPWRFFESL